MMAADTEQLVAEDSCPGSPPPPHKSKIIWSDVVPITYFHIAAVYGAYLALTHTKWQTLVFITLLFVLTKIGVTAGAHRLWTHRSYKANFPLRALLMLFFTMAFQNTLWLWVINHRLHHKYQETDADPYNAKRGLWFSHMGWLLQSPHPDVIEKAKDIDMSDLRADSLVMFQKKYYWHIVYLLSLILPTVIPVYCWDESWTTAWHVVACLRTIIVINTTCLVNSIAHKYGSRPYDMKFFARDNKTVALMTLGEGWHNYHHAFPWDYKTSEMGTYGFNLTTGFIDLFAKIGWAYDLKTAPADMVRKRALRTGDGSYKTKELWGWDDKDMPKEDRVGATIINRKEA